MASNSDLEILAMWHELCALECSLNAPSQDENTDLWNRYDELFSAIATYDACSPLGVMVKLAIAGGPMFDEQQNEDTQEGKMLYSAVETASRWLMKNHSDRIQ